MIKALTALVTALSMAGAAGATAQMSPGYTTHMKDGDVVRKVEDFNKDGRLDDIRGIVRGNKEAKELRIDFYSVLTQPTGPSKPTPLGHTYVKEGQCVDIAKKTNEAVFRDAYALAYPCNDYGSRKVVAKFTNLGNGFDSSLQR
jgi:hypothetical protein